MFCLRLTMMKMLITSVIALVFTICISITKGVPLGQTGVLNRTNYRTNTMTICGITTCWPGTRIKPCVQNYTMDTCEVCQEGYEMLDYTTSSQVLIPCVKKKDCSEYEHTIYSTERNYCYGDEVHLPCKCDVKNGFCGDPCHCLYQGNNCQPGEILHHRNCSCIRDPGTTTTTTTTTTPSTTGLTQSISAKSPTTELSYTRNLTSDPVTPQPSETTNISSISEGTSLSTPSSQPDNEQKEREDKVSWKTIGAIFGLLLLVICVCVIAVGVVYSKEIRESNVFKNWPCSCHQYHPTSTTPN